MAFFPHGRDYRFAIQDNLCSDPGTYELVFTHVVDLKYQTRVGDNVWPQSWGDEFTHYAKWKQAGEPEGYVFGTDWSLAYPGITILASSPDAQNWSERLARSMHSVEIETDRFSIRLVFSEARHRKLSDQTGGSSANRHSLVVLRKAMVIAWFAKVFDKVASRKMPGSRSQIGTGKSASRK